jgi:hypothetical protein
VLTERNSGSNRRRFVRKLLGLAAVGGLASVLLGRDVGEVRAVTQTSGQLAYFTDNAGTLQSYPSILDANGNVAFASNTATGGNATVGGGAGNAASGQYSTVGGGQSNGAILFASTVGGGALNKAGGEWSTVGGGVNNTASGYISTVGGGNQNTAGGSESTVAGGLSNTASNQYATVAGGFSGAATSYGSTVGGGVLNTAAGPVGASTVGGGYGNKAGGIGLGYTFVGGGSQNTAQGDYSTVGGGESNTASNQYATVAGGFSGAATGDSSTVGGGNGNRASNTYATVAGGLSGAATGVASTVGGGANNVASGSGATVGGGVLNTATGESSTVGGGNGNTASADWATVGGGLSGAATYLYATVGGGQENTASGPSATVGGGGGNKAGGSDATVGGGQLNSAGGTFSTVPGGYLNRAFADQSFAAGTQAVVSGAYTGAFVWADSYGLDFPAVAANEFAIRAVGGVRLVTGVAQSGITRQLTVSPSGFLGVSTSGASTPQYAFDLHTPGSSSAQMHISSAGADSGGYLTSANAGNLFMAGGAAWNGSAWVAKSSTSYQYGGGPSGVRFFFDTGLTVGGTYAPTTRMFIGPTGNVGIGMSTQPGHLLQLGLDDAAKPSTNTWTIASDGRLKDPESIEPFTEGSELIRRLPQPVWFRYRKDSGLPSDRRVAGWVAQDIATVAPFMVRRTKQKLALSDPDETDTLSLNTNELPYALVNSVREILERVEEKDRENAEILEQLRETRLRNTELKAESDCMKIEITKLKQLIDSRARLTG